MVSSAIWKKHARVSFFKDHQNCEGRVNSEGQVQFDGLKTHECMFFKLHEKPY